MFGYGNKDAEIAIIEEFPLEHEYINKKIFLGGTGYTYQTMLSAVNLKREDIWTTSYLGNYAKKLREYFYDNLCAKLKYEYNDYANLLVQELSQLPNLKVIIPVGNASLQAITGLRGISDYRGSILPISDSFCRAKKDVWKVIPTYSPREINIDYHLKVYTTIDLKRALVQKDIKGIIRTTRRMIIEPTFKQATDYLENIIKNKITCAADIETRGVGHATEIDCISFAISPNDGISVPFLRIDMSRYWTDIHESNYISNLVKQIIDDPNIGKIYQNGMFDTWVMGNLGYNPKGLIFDTMFAAHCMYCELEKDLGTLTSIYTDEPYYKFERTQAKKDLDKGIKHVERKVKTCLSEAKKQAKKRGSVLRKIKRTALLKPTPKRLLDLEKWSIEKEGLRIIIKSLMVDYKKTKSSLESEKHEFNHNADITRWIYNTKDSLVTKEISEKQEVILKAMGLWEFFNKYYIKIFPIAYDISMKGLKIDEVKRNEVSIQVNKGLEEMHKDIYAKVGYEFNTESPSQLIKVLYETLQLPVQTNKGRITTDAKALDRLIEKTNNPVLEDIVDIRKLAKLQSTYLNSRLDNGCIRSEMVIAHTTSGRWASRKSPFGSGGNLQNIPSGKTEISDRVLKVLNNDKNIIRSVFVPSIKNGIFIEVDLSAAEVWYVGYRSKDEFLIDALTHGKDIHSMTASIYLEKTIEMVKKYERQIAKRVNHGFHYHMSAKTMATVTKLPIDFINKAFAKLYKVRPKIKEYHEFVENNIIEHHCLVNAWGRKRIFFDRIPYLWKNNKKVATPDEVYRSGYSYIPQSSVGDTVGHALLNVIQDLNSLENTRVALQVHDSLLIETIPKNIEDILLILYNGFNIKQCPWGDEFTIPVDMAIGFDWGNMCEIATNKGIIDYTKKTFLNKETNLVEKSKWYSILEKVVR